MSSPDSFWPPGWDRERLLNATSAELLTLPDEQRFGMFDGIRATLGEEGLQETRQEMSRRYRARLAAAASAESTAQQQPQQQEVPQVPMTDEEKRLAQELTAPYINVLDKLFQGNPWEEWGFVVFQCTGYAKEQQQRWTAFRQRWDEIINEETSRHRGTSPRVDEAVRLIRFQWVSDPSLDGASMGQVAERYKNMHLPRGLNNSICLAVTPASLDSVLTSPLPSSAPRSKRAKIPYVVAVSKECIDPPTHQEEEEEEEEEDIAGQDFKGYFKVAVESLLQELFPIVALDITDLYKLAARLRSDDDIWCSHDRRGVHRVSSV
ncbi:hypothetical protein L228DRAFT_262923 [Xylona heveae TC161]|uniref:Uncharacterized protein n=1 Tax=Xylona heveae (strain CBS 132557 / TC161) TaxID=1328760 RepID=A0A165ACE7_XYLHT|nr:hypothetical protein L228DRAFT_262923 [Xylona heveae TC161]KZF20248.1 hypothetical protein L228DRAFT_262923 [Xylona heveae TC161]